MMMQGAAPASLTHRGPCEVHRQSQLHEGDVPAELSSFPPAGTYWDL
ncbi:hypothetical protein [Rathayibacter tritici]|nr:hypothetical protein [Rathayibacter tritici]